MKDPAFGEDAVRALASIGSFTRGRECPHQAPLCQLDLLTISRPGI